MTAEEKATPDRAAERSAARGSQSNPEATPEEVRYPLDDLKADAPHLLGVSPHAVAGAMFGETRKTLTLDEAKERVDAFLGREVQT